MNGFSFVLAMANSAPTQDPAPSALGFFHNESEPDASPCGYASVPASLPKRGLLDASYLVWRGLSFGFNMSFSPMGVACTATPGMGSLERSTLLIVEALSPLGVGTPSPFVRVRECAPVGELLPWCRTPMGVAYPW